MRSPGLVLLLLCFAGCVPTADQQAAAFVPSISATGMRALQSRRLDSQDLPLMMQAAVGTLQDLGFTIEETQAEHGIIVAAKLAGSRIRAQVVLRPALGSPGTIIRVNFQRIIARPGAMLSGGETLTEPELYQGFFEKFSQSAFLTLHEI